MKAQTKVAIRQFAAERDGKTVIVLEGARLAATDSVVKAHPTMFEPAGRVDVEPATAAPGEKRRRKPARS